MEQGLGAGLGSGRGLRMGSTCRNNLGITQGREGDEEELFHGEIKRRSHCSLYSMFSL